MNVLLSADLALSMNPSCFGNPGLPLLVILHFSFSFLQGVPQLPCAKALYNYDGKEPGDLKFSKGDIIILRRQVDENWYHGEMGGVHGFFPTNFVQVIKPLPQPPPQCKALYDFELKDKEADKDCLPFSKVLEIYSQYRLQPSSLLFTHSNAPSSNYKLKNKL